MGIGKNINRVDARAKVTGEAKYTADLIPANFLSAKVVHSTIANGLVTGFDLQDALSVPGVIKIITCFDVPDITFPTCGHPWSTVPEHQDVADRKLLNTRVRCYGDDVAAVIAKDDLSALKAARLVKVLYETYPPLITVSDAQNPGATPVHDSHPDNILAHSEMNIGEGTYEDAISESALLLMEKEYQTQRVQHCHLEPVISCAWQDSTGKTAIISSTQIPHIVRRVVGQALGIPWGQIRVIKPFIGGGFGNKQEVLYEPLNAFLSMQMGGRGVRLELSREELMICTRVRHAINFHVKAAVRPDGTLVARHITVRSNQGAYASHGHAIAANAANMIKQLYHDEKFFQADCYTIYTNTATAGAMRGYGIPQGDFASECMIDDLAAMTGLDPLEFRLLNCVEAGYKDPHNGITFHSYGLKDCILKGRKLMQWDKKRAEYKEQSGLYRRGIGMAAFCYKTGVYPISLETASCRMSLNQDGSIQLQMGATEIGQGADTVFTQMASETLGIPENQIYIVSSQDTDVTPFDTGAYASRQTYVSGKALKKTAVLMKEKILDYAAFMTGIPADSLDVENGSIISRSGHEIILAMESLAQEAFYSLEHSIHITAEATSQCKENTLASGVCFAEIEVDVALGKIKVLKILNVHDSGVLINPQLAKAQVHGGMSMGLGYGLGEILLYNDNGRPLNNNLLDYKLPTSMDTPDLNVEFIELEDPTGPYGNKSLGEPPAIPVAPALRNALLHATGVAVDSLPLDPQKLIEHFQKASLLDNADAAKEGAAHV